MRYDLKKSGGAGSGSQYLELWKDGQFIARNADVWNLFETLSQQPAGDYEIRQPAIYVTAVDETQTQAMDLEVRVGLE
jgi:hypothetical protein